MNHSEIAANPNNHVPFLRDPRKLSILYQVLVLGIVVFMGWYIYDNTVDNLARRAIATGFGFLKKEAAFEIGESVIAYSAANSFGRALLVGFLNTLKVSFIGVILTVILGAFVGVARLSTNWLLSKMAAIYIEVMQNIPVLLQLFFWYAVFNDGLPGPRESLNPLNGIFINNRGLFLAVPEKHPAHIWIFLAFLLACLATWLIARWAKKRQERTGYRFPAFKAGILVILGLPTLVWLAWGAPIAMNVPELKGFNFEGGTNFSPEFAALLLGLVLYTAAFVAEIVRAGIQSVGRGQREAAMSVGLRPGHVLGLVIMPQALRVIIPPLTSQMLNLTKNSSLAIAIGFPDFVSVANTIINQSGQAIEGVALIMLCYLIFSLSTSAFMNWYNKKTALVER